MIFIFALILVLFLYGAASWRLRGSGLVADFIARFGIWGMTVGTVVCFDCHNFLYTFLSIILAGIGASFGYVGQFDLAAAANKNWKNYLILTFTGCARMAPLFAAACLVIFAAEAIIESNQ